MVDAGEIFHPLRWTPAGGVPLPARRARSSERAGVVVRVPATWRASRPPRPQVTATVGGKAPSGLGQDALLDFRMEVTLDGERLTAAEIEGAAGERRRAGARPRPLGRGRPRAARAGCSSGSRRSSGARPRAGSRFAEAMRLLAGADVAGRRSRGSRRSRLVARRRRAVARRDARRGCARPEGLAQVDPGRELHGDAAALPAGRRALAAPALAARPRRLPRRRHGPRQDHPGARAAARAARERGRERRPSLLVAPASLLANWAAEIERFAPSLAGARRASVGDAGRAS